MANVFLISDTHFGHANCLNFMNKDETAKLRPFSSLEEMDETMVDNWNKVVAKSDKVYHLGDIAMSHKNLPILNRLNGRKVLIKGNHDKAKLSQYLPYFYDIRATHQLDRMILSHVPIWIGSLDRWDYNVHGHLHDRVVTHIVDGFVEADPKYISVCVEQPHINYTPISLEELKLHLNRQLK